MCFHIIWKIFKPLWSCQFIFAHKFFPLQCFCLGTISYFVEVLVFVDNLIYTNFCDFSFPCMRAQSVAASVNCGTDTFCINWQISVSVVQGFCNDYWMFSIQVSSGLIVQWMPVPLCVWGRDCSVTPFKTECQLLKHKNACCLNRVLAPMCFQDTCTDAVW